MPDLRYQSELSAEQQKQQHQQQHQHQQCSKLVSNHYNPETDPVILTDTTPTTSKSSETTLTTLYPYCLQPSSSTSEPPSMTINHRRPRDSTVIPKWPSISQLYSDEYLSAAFHARATLNNMGYSYDIGGPEIDYWLESLPSSRLPLADLGAGYGFQTGAALATGRDVIAVDCNAKHISMLRERVACAHAAAASIVEQTDDDHDNDSDDNDGLKLGRLISAITVSLPCAAALRPQSVCGVLVSDVIQFIPYRFVLSLFKHIFDWLVSDGRVVVTTISPAGFTHRLERRKLSFASGRKNVEETWEFIEQCHDDLTLVTDRPWRLAREEKAPKMKIKDMKWIEQKAEDGCRDIAPAGSAFSTQELTALARLAGFQVEVVDYLTQQKYPVRYADSDEMTLLVAKKP